MTGYIYLCTFNNKIYIGESLNAMNPNYLGRGKLWLTVIHGHEKEVNKRILETIEHSDKKTLKTIMHKREIYWINYYNSTDPNIGYNISPGGNLFAESSRQKMIMSDSKTMKDRMKDSNLRHKISEGLKRQRKEVGMSDTHKANLSKRLKGRNIGCNGDSRSIQVYCVVNNKKYTFHNKIQAAKWWYDNYPFSDIYATITYTRMITKSINNLPLTYKSKPINQNIQWFKDTTQLTKNDPVYCIFNNIRYDFKTTESAAKWWFENYPLGKDEYNSLRYITKIHKNIKGFDITYKGFTYDKIKWFRKE